MRLIQLSLCLLLLASTACERNTTYNYYYPDETDDTSGKGSTTGGSSSSDDTWGDDDDDDDDGTNYGDEGDEPNQGTVEGVISVADALAQNYGMNVTVEGYVVGASPSNVSKTVFEAPFTSSANIVLADKPYTGEDIPKDELIQVKLTDNTSKSFREDVNLRDHPELHNKRVQVSGTTETYYKRIAICYVWLVQNME